MIKHFIPEDPNDESIYNIVIEKDRPQKLFKSKYASQVRAEHQASRRRPGGGAERSERPNEKVVGSSQGELFPGSSSGSHDNNNTSNGGGMVSCGMVTANLKSKIKAVGKSSRLSSSSFSSPLTTSLSKTRASSISSSNSKNVASKKFPAYKPVDKPKRPLTKPTSGRIALAAEKRSNASTPVVADPTTWDNVAADEAEREILALKTKEDAGDRDEFYRGYHNQHHNHHQQYHQIQQQHQLQQQQQTYQQKQRQQHYQLHQQLHNHTQYQHQNSYHQNQHKQNISPHEEEDVPEELIAGMTLDGHNDDNDDNDIHCRDDSYYSRPTEMSSVGMDKTVNSNSSSNSIIVSSGGGGGGGGMVSSIPRRSMAGAKFKERSAVATAPHPHQHQHHNASGCSVSGAPVRGISSAFGISGDVSASRRMVPEGERLVILAGLKSNHAALMGMYNRLPMSSDTSSKINRQKSIENQLRLLEEDIKKFSTPNIMVDNNS